MPGIGRFDNGPIKLAALQHAHADGDDPADFKPRAAQFAVAHDGMDVAHLEQRAFNLHRQIHPAARSELLGVHVAAVLSGIAAGDGFSRRGNAHDADHRVDRNDQAAEFRLAVLHGKDAGTVHAPIIQRADVRNRGDGALIRHFNGQHIHDEHVAGHGPFHIERPRRRVGTRKVERFTDNVFFRANLAGIAIQCAEREFIPVFGACNGFIRLVKGIHVLSEFRHDTLLGRHLLEAIDQVLNLRSQRYEEHLRPFKSVCHCINNN